MKLNEYQEKARSFAVYPDIGDNITYPTLGLVGEAGEVANQVKKVDRDDKGIITGKRRDYIADELGDVLWYVANLAEEIGIPLEKIVEWNLAKLTARQRQDQIHGDKRQTSFNLTGHGSDGEGQ